MNEAETRAELIDPQLKEAGWGTVPASSIRREFRISDGQILADGGRGRQLVADYVLEYKGRMLAVIEAKSDKVEVAEGVAQAKLYAEKLGLRTSFSANGRQIYQICRQPASEGPVESFPGPEELWQRSHGQAGEWVQKLSQVPFEEKPDRRLRYYQRLAVDRVLDAMAAGRQRVLLTLATGTGKTYIAFQIAWKLFESRWNLQRDGKRRPRILFLADRNLLADQAYTGFDSFPSDALVRINPDEIKKKGGDVPRNGSIFFTIFQTFMSGSESRKYYEAYGRDFFDLVIIDECHRGGASYKSTWRGILDHFQDAVHLGLTATPRRQDNADTYEYFGEPVYTYSLKDGIQEGFLVPFKVKRIQTTIDDYVYSPEDDVIEGDVEEGHVYTEEEFNRDIEIRERERKRVQEMLAAINKDEKTMVFCANQAHAALVRDLINQEAGSAETDYCVRVTSNDGDIGEMHLNRFRDDERDVPTIVTTSHKLSTGVDACNVRNIVLMRPIGSMIEFKQIIGRGTRLHEDKAFFTIIDFVGAYRHFSDPEWDGEPVAVEQPEDDYAPPGRRSGSKHSGGNGDDEPERTKVKIRLSDGKVRELQSMTRTLLYVGGKVVSEEDFVRRLFETMHAPEMSGGKEGLRAQWADPDARANLLDRLEDAGFRRDALDQLQALVDAQECDMLDVLEYVADATPPITRRERVDASRARILASLEGPQAEFVEFVLANYIKEGADEFNELSTMLNIKYGGPDDAEQKLGVDIEQIRRMFTDLQQHLYLAEAA